MAPDLAAAQRTTLEMYREFKGEPLALQGVTDIANGVILRRIDEQLGNGYDAATTAYYAGRIGKRPIDVKSFLPQDIVRELEGMVLSGDCESVAFGFMDIVDRAIRNLSLTRAYQNPTLVGLYERARNAVALSIQELHQHTQLPKRVRNITA